MSSTAEGNRSGWLLFHLRGIQVTLDPKWLMISFLFLCGLTASDLPRTFRDHSLSIYWLVAFVGSALISIFLTASQPLHVLTAKLSRIICPQITRFSNRPFSGHNGPAPDSVDPANR